MLSMEGHILGGCKLIRKLGTGGMGDVYLAEQQRVGNRLVAVKIVPADDAGSSPESIRDTQHRFQREAALLGRLRHDNILPVYDSGTEQDLLYLVTEYVPDGSLADSIRGTARHKLTLPLPLPFAVDVVSQIASALEYTHENNIVHRDVKPGNVLIRVEPNGHWHCMLADYGVARTINTTSPRTQVTGTFAYMAPEQFHGQFFPATDQYALAIMTFQLLAGRTPFEGDMAALAKAHMYDTPPSLHKINPAVPAAVDAVLVRALAKDPQQRYPSVAEFARELRIAAGLDATTQRDISVPLPPPPESAPQGKPARPPANTQTYATHAVRPLRLGRILVTSLLAVVLLASVVLGSMWAQGAGFFARGQQQGTATATISGEPTATATTGTSACTTQGSTTIIGCFSAPPVSGSTVVLQDASPLCDGKDYGWQAAVMTTHDCPAGGGLTISAAPSSNLLACINAQAQSAVTQNGYVSVQVTPASGAVVLGFRENVSTTSQKNNIEGYNFWVYPQNGAYSEYALYKITSAGDAITLHQPSLLATNPGQSFELGAAYQGSTITLYVNGKQIATSTDATFASGWFGLCTQGSATFQNAQLYSLAG